MGIISAVVGQAANVRILFFFALPGKMLTSVTDQHARANLHLRSPLHCDGGHCRSLTI